MATMGILMALTVGCQSSEVEEPEWVDPGTSVGALGSLVIRAEGGGSDGCSTEEECVEVTRDMCWLGALGAEPTTVALVEIEGPGRVVQSTEDCAADYYWPGRMMPVRVLAVVGGERLPYRTEVFMPDGMIRDRAFVGTVLLAGLRASPEWFMLNNVPVEVYGETVANAANHAVALPSTFEGLVAEYQRVKTVGADACTLYTRMDDKAFHQYVHTPWACEIIPPGSNTGEVEPRDPTHGEGYDGVDDPEGTANP